MSDWKKLSENSTALDECFLGAAEGQTESLEKLNDLAENLPRDFRKWPAPVQAAWQGDAELFIDAIGGLVDQPAVARWMKLSAAAGYDSPVFRDALATCLRTAFPDYLDPAGMISAMGIHDASVKTRQIYGRWQRFEFLHEGRHCCHAAYGAGTVDEVDALTSEVRVHFDRCQVLPLDVFLDSVQMVKDDSLLARILKKNAPKKQLDKGNLLPDLKASLVPPGGDARFFKKCLVPRFLSDKVYAKAVASGAGKAVAARREEEGTRTIADARSAHELVEVLKPLKEASFGDEEIANVNRLLMMCAAKDDQAELLRDVVVRLWQLAPGVEWLQEGLRTDLADAVAFQDVDRFVTLTDELSGKAVGAWLAATATGIGASAFLQLAVHLPLRIWTPVEHVLKELNLDKELLVKAAVKGVRTAATCDMVLWLWRSKSPEKKVLRDVSLVMKALAVPVKGPFIKANRDLRKMFVTDEKFHKFLFEGRSIDSSRAVVRAVEHSAVLDSGERQSMLVRLVRSFSELRSIIEKRGGPVKKKAIPRMTSIRSYENRRLELEDIINTKIPANSRAIAVAREHGDLRENAEYKAAKDEQAYLTARRNELENDLDDVRPVDFSQIAAADQVIPGCMFDLKTEDGGVETYCLLGLWDSHPEKKMLSYETPLGAAVLSAKVGDEVDLPNGETGEVTKISLLPKDVLNWLNEGGE